MLRDLEAICWMDIPHGKLFKTRINNFNSPLEIDLKSFPAWIKKEVVSFFSEGILQETAHLCFLFFLACPGGYFFLCSEKYS
jgi:hypothetical protein